MPSFCNENECSSSSIPIFQLCDTLSLQAVQVQAHGDTTGMLMTGTLHPSLAFAVTWHTELK